MNYPEAHQICQGFIADVNAKIKDYPWISMHTFCDPDFKSWFCDSSWNFFSLLFFFDLWTPWMISNRALPNFSSGRDAS